MTDGRSLPKERGDGDFGDPAVDIRKEGSFTCEKERPLDVEDEARSSEASEGSDGRSTLRVDKVGLTGEWCLDI